MKRNTELLTVGSLVLVLAMTIAWQGLALARNNSDRNFEDRRPGYVCSVRVPEPEPKDLSSLAEVKADAAIGAALAANPGTAATEVKLEKENGWLVYSVHLNNGLEITVDAGKGTVVHSQPNDSHEKESEYGDAREDDDQPHRSSRGAGRIRSVLRESSRSFR